MSFDRPKIFCDKAAFGAGLVLLDEAEFDELRREFDSAIAQIEQQQKMIRTQVKQREIDCAWADERDTDQRKRIADLEAALDGANMRVSSDAEKLAAKDAEIDRLRSDLANERTANDAIAQESADKDRLIIHLTNNLGQTPEKVAQMERIVEVRDAQIHNPEHNLKVVKDEGNWLRDDNSRLERFVMEQRGEISALRDELCETKLELSDLKEKYEGTIPPWYRDQLDRIKRDVKSLLPGDRLDKMAKGIAFLVREAGSVA